LLLLSAALWAQEPETQVSISVSNNLAYVGDVINLKIIVKTTHSNVQEIKVKTEKKDFDILEQHPTQKRQQPGFHIFEKNISVAFFKVGDFEVGPFSIDLIKGEKAVATKKTNSVPVKIKSVLKKDDKDIKPLKNLIDIKGDPWYLLKYVILGLVILGIILFLIFYIRKRRKAIPPSPKPLIPPLEELELSLKGLADKKLFQKGKVKFHFIELTQIFKRFISRNYHFNAEDFTTEETLYYLKQKEQENLIRDNMRFVFNTADLVKFAKFIPDETVLTEIDEKIKEMITRFKLRLSAAQESQVSGKSDEVKGTTPEKPTVTGKGGTK